MSRKTLLVGLLSILWVSAAPAGEIKFHFWPCVPAPQEVATIPVLMDIGYWIEILNPDAVIKLKQTAIHTYEGCVNLHVRTNTYLTMTCTIASAGVIPGTYTCSVGGANIDPPGDIAAICAKLTDANLARRPGGTTNLRVATVTVRVVPRAL